MSEHLKANDKITGSLIHNESAILRKTWIISKNNFNDVGLFFNVLALYLGYLQLSDKSKGHLTYISKPPHKSSFHIRMHVTFLKSFSPFLTHTFQGWKQDSQIFKICLHFPIMFLWQISMKTITVYIYITCHVYLELSWSGQDVCYVMQDASMCHI